MQVKVVVAVDEAAGKSGFLEGAPLMFQLAADPAAEGGREGQGEPSPNRGMAPRPRGPGQGTRIAQVQMPSNFQTGSGSRQRDGFLSSLLSHHQARPGEGAVDMGVQNRPVHPGVPAEVVGDEGQLQSVGHAAEGFTETRGMAIRS